ncbi:MAG: glycolate oxidase subunit GlcF [Gammaproteobacteria bacterium]|jgi:glycolate oxidase iron-sulfur subunit
MQTSLIESLKDTTQGKEAESILRACVHCGFCTATCPTYQVLGDELDGPRGRIYLIKQVLEGNAVSVKTQVHLDRCLHCLACETTCPSGVRYGRLVDIGRELVDSRVQRPVSVRLLRRALRLVLPHPRRFAFLLGVGRRLQALLPAGWSGKIPRRQAAASWPKPRHPRKMLVLDGCVQSVVGPATNAAAARVFDRLGISLIRAEHAGCCGALSHHLTAHREALNFVRRNIEAWWPYVESGVEAIVMTASGCGAMVKEYGLLLRDDAAYAQKAARIASMTQDLSEILAEENLPALDIDAQGKKVAFQAPCTLQHGQRITGLVEGILSRCGYRLTAVPDAHLCCGSAGTYSILQPELSQQLLAAKVKALQSGGAALIATANIGCQLHVQTRATLPVRHWVELLDGASMADD